MAIRYRYYFLEALAITIILFIVGFLLGLSLEMTRNAQLNEYYNSTQSELSVLELQLRTPGLEDINCSKLIAQNFELGDKIYQQALIFQDYETAAIFTKSELIEEHRKFDILRTMYWINSINIKKICGNDSFKTIVYLYDYPATKIEDISKQRVMEKISQEIRDSTQDSILIPIAKNLNITELNELIKQYPKRNESVLLIINEKDEFGYDEAKELIN
jgi:hypothetical protein